MAIYRILALDGGGVRGTLTATILQRLSEQVPGWLDEVDLIAGTSTGGILALGLARGLTPAELQELYCDNCAEVFDDSWLDNILDLGQVVGAQFSNKNLAKMIDKVIGPVRLDELEKRVLISAFDLDNEAEEALERSWKPKFFHNFPGEDSDGHFLARDVALYTSAAPSYFPAVDGYIDGGVVANNPSMAALAQVLDYRADIPERPLLNEVRLLSVGTGKPLNFIHTRRKYLDWGYAHWVKPILDIMMDGSMGLADFQCQQLLGRHQYLRINPVLTEAIGLAAYKKVDELMHIGETCDLTEAVEWLENSWMETEALFELVPA